jgi:TatD DNase family protein
MTQIKYFDIHSHLDFPDYKEDFPEIMSRMTDAQIGTITIGTDLESSKRAVQMAETYPNVWACIGIHPADNHAESWDEEEFAKLVSHPRVVAVGECGLDFFRLPVNEKTGEVDLEEADLEKVTAEKERQQILFEKQIQFAIKYDKTLMIHCRDAYEEVFETLAKYKKESSQLRIHLHFYAGDIEITKKFLELDCTFSFTGVITFAKQYDEVIKFLPLEKIMSETDAPFVAPVPNRGRRNEPAFVIEVIRKLAELRNLPLEEMSEILYQNAITRFNIKI